MSEGLGHGMAITFDSGFFAEITSIQKSNVSRQAVETTNFATTLARTFVPSNLFDPGQIQVEFNLDASLVPKLQVAGGNAAETVTITHTDAGAATEAADGFMLDYGYSAPDTDQRVKGSATIKLSGAITHTP